MLWWHDRILCLLNIGIVGYLQLEMGLVVAFLSLQTLWTKGSQMLMHRDYTEPQKSVWGRHRDLRWAGLCEFEVFLLLLSLLFLFCFVLSFPDDSKGLCVGAIAPNRKWA